MRIALIVFLSMVLTYPIQSLAEDIEDGTYDATVTTDSGAYSVPVEVEDGEVTHVQWPNGGNMSVNGANLDNGEASGWNSKGDHIEIEIDQ